MKHNNGTNGSTTEEQDEMKQARQLLRKGTGATLAIAPLGFPGRIVWTGYARLSDDYDRTLDAVNFVPNPVHSSPPSDPAPLTVELRLKEATQLSIDEGAEYGGLALHWQTPLGKMELALYEDDSAVD